MKWKPIAARVFFVVFLVFLVSGFYYAGGQADAILCRGVEITILDSGELAFVTKARIRRYIQDQYGGTRSEPKRP